MMEFMEALQGVDLQQGMLLLCLVLVIMMFAALLLLHRRTRQAEKQVQEMTKNVSEQLAASDERTRESSQRTQRELSEAMQSVNDSMVRMMGEMTRTQQGQMDSLGGQLRAVSRQEEERMERMRETMDRRLNTYEEKLSGVTRTLDDKLTGNEERMERMRETLEGGLQRMSDDNKTQLEQMRITVDEKLNETVDRRLEASFAQVTRRLEQVTSSLSAMQSLAGSVDELSRTLGGAQPLGAWGEMQLGALLAQMLAPDQYAQRASVRPGGEPVADYVVVMPGQGHGHTVYLPIDSSLPMREYTELRTALESGTREEVDDARGLLESAVRMHARRMSEKLIAPPYTTDYAVLFLSSEGLFSEILRISGLAERIQTESRMVVAGPTTLSALLSSLQMGFRSLAIEQRTEEIMALLGAVRTDFGGFANLLSRTQKRLRQASETIETAQRHSETIARRLSDVGELPAGEAHALLGGEGEEDDPFDDDGAWD
ncbi:MAG: DNA recombination protein RmuC [Clostridia bacterium]|nr:DNA recombination protein RmuC [Clostridia bacterium]MBQ4608023.1 DNA recombination protein RmuC [Clostridia bacterium]MBQ7052275.1 DNA recombination protein RmuC [Clostridia bacterium]